MKSKSLQYLEYPTRSIPKTKAFFSTVFGWEFIDYGDMYCAFSLDNVDGGFFQSDVISDTGNGAHCGTSVTFKGEDAITRFASSAWAERGFCHRCGTHLFYQYMETGEYFVPAGIFSDDSLTLASEIFVDEKGSYYQLDANSKKMTGAEVLASFSQEDKS